VKPSQYNHYIPLEDDKNILYNTLSGAILIVDEDARNSIEQIQEVEAELPQDMLNNFRQNGVVVETNENELLKFRDRYNTMRYDPQRLSFGLTPTARCNLSCEYCWQRIDQSLAERHDQVTTMSESTLKGVLLFVKQTIETLNATNLPIFFFGGEPLMAKKLVFRILEDLAQWSEERSVGFNTTFYTNCTLFDQFFIDGLQKYTVNLVKTTLDGPQEIHDQYRHYKNGEGTYENIVTNIGMVLDAGINVEIQFNINRHYEHMPELFDDLSERGLKQIIVAGYPVYDPPIVIQEVQKAYGLLDERFPIPQSQFAIPFKEVPEVRTQIYRWAFEKGFKLPPPDLGLLRCSAVSYYHNIIDPSGDVYKCVATMLLKFMRTGRIHENGYFEHYPFFYEWVDNDPTYVEPCQSCSLLPSCWGGCIFGRKLIGVSHVCEVSQFCGEEYIKMYLEQKYPEKLKFLKME